MASLLPSSQLSEMETNKELSPIYTKPNPSLDGSSFISIEPRRPISTKPNPSFDGSSFISIEPSPISSTKPNPNPSYYESSTGSELSPTSTEPNHSFDDSSNISIEPSPSSSEHITSIKPKPSSDTNLTSVNPNPNSVERNLRIAERNASFKRCLSVTPTTTDSLKSNKAPSTQTLAMVSPPSLSRFLALLPSPSTKSKAPLKPTSSCKNNSTGCDRTNFILNRAHNSCTLRSILKCGPRDGAGLMVSRKVEINVSTATPNHDSSPVSVSQVKKATGGFSNSLLIGQGMFSSVYDGTLKDGTRVAIKCDKKSLYNPKGSTEFQSNIKMLRNIDHPNLVKFYGYLEHNENSIFILEYVPNGNLRQHLDGRYMGFGVRMDIAIDIAHGLAYLHDANKDEPIIHGRLQSSNILLSSNMRAMVSDYGFPPAAGVRFDYSSSNIILLSYCDPEFLSTFRLTGQSDVYSFGVVLVELITGRPPLMGEPGSFEYVTTEWAKTMFDQGKGSVVLDPHVPRIPATMIVMDKVLALAVLCLNREGKNRPTMSFCAEALEQISEEYTLLLFGKNR